MFVFPIGCLNAVVKNDFSYGRAENRSYKGGK